MRNIWNLFVLFFIVKTTSSVYGAQTRHKRQAAGLTPGNWDSCKPGAPAPPTRVNTTDRVIQLRTYFTTLGIQAYLVPSADAHQSEYPSQYDKRRGFISGFKGSAGFAVITINKQALWTDGRYFLEAEDTLDCNWILMRHGEPGVPTMTEWLKKELSRGNFLGVSPFLVGSSDWKKYEEELLASGIHMRPVQEELIDRFWNSTLGRPEIPNTPIKVLPLQFAGRTWQDKVSDMRTAMEAKRVDMLVVTALDETAWLFNLRATDIDYNPFFISYAIVEKVRVTLFLLNHLTKITANPTDKASTVTVAEHLNTNNDGTCANKTGACVEVKAYNPDDVINTVKSRSQTINKIWLGYSCNYAIYSAVNESKIHQANTPIAIAKVRKNPVEVAGMKNSHIRDAAALISFLEKLEKEVKAGKVWTELSAAKDLERYRTKQKYNRGLSFKSISGFGANGAIIHYSVTNVTNINITTNGMYLLDSGGQYLDGTTDVTRTFHYGIPTDYQKECYTRVLMGHIDLFQAKWPKGLYGREIDTFARRPLWDVGLVYRHGTGHGIGMYLSVHEGPGRISLSHSSYERDNILDTNQFFSDEPGYYEDGKFGIRLENIVMVKNASTTYTFPGTQFLTFEHVTLVPYEPHLIKFELLSGKQICYLNGYSKMVRDHVGPELKRQRKYEAYEWMMRKTEPV
ncbi:xaa-Pro aminopeptidase 1-like [Mercenaria mercenaria]|uniref:xaa-Pro aminopeptidase 1-like n=1 Tax=Mercenaria mercenaria TaxID=6596 RepID=UPI00234F9564|nr:xaa-Pro aminopeptidase 1-like [Mercenaria mercenaria]